MLTISLQTKLVDSCFIVFVSVCATDIFLPTPDSLLVNLNECKEVGKFQVVLNIMQMIVMNFNLFF